MTVNCTNTSSLSLEENSHKKRRTIPQKSESELVKIFWGAPIEAFFGQETVAPVVDCSTKPLNVIAGVA